jgi:alpha-L-rhamnosidase
VHFQTHVVLLPRYVAGLGYAKTWLNGNRTDTRELGQFVTFQERVLYDCLDVTSLVREGRNALGVMLGNGWFAEPSIAAGPQQFMLLLSVTTTANTHGTTTSSGGGGVGAGTSNAVAYFSSALVSTVGAGSGAHVNPGADVGPSTAPTTRATTAITALVFTATAGPATSVSMDSGESYDGRIAASIEGWTIAGYTPSPNSQPWVPAVAPPVGPAAFGSQMSARTVPIVTERDYEAVTITEPTPGVHVVDFGQNMAGQVTLRINSCPRGRVISLQHTEILYPDGRAHNSFCERPKYWLCGVQQMANYTCAGGGPEVYRVAFVYMG